MARVVAVTEIHEVIQPGKPADKDKGIKAVAPTKRIIPAGTVFSVVGSREEELRGLKAIRDLLPGEKVAVPAESFHVEAESEVAERVKAGKAKKAAAPAFKSKAKKDEDDNGDDASDLV